MTNVTQYKDPTDTTRGPSPVIWADCPWSEIFNQVGQGQGGYQFFDDFLHGGITPTITTAIDLTGGSGYSAFGSAGATMTYDDVAGGAIVLTEATADESLTLYTENHPYRISQDAGKLWFEARIKCSGIVTNANSFFVGLMDTTTPTDAVPLTATGALADMNLVGFHAPEANTSAFDASYKADGVTAVEVNSDIGTLVADTYVKLGMVYDPTPSTTGTKAQLVFYVDGAKQASVATIPDATGTDFPADIGLGLGIALAVGAGAETDTLTMDWWRVAQLVDPAVT